MSDALIRRRKQESEQEIVLRLLEHVDADKSVSQAGFAQQVGIAKGLANAYFNRCIQKGWIKLRQAPKQRYLYYLTPKGFSEKARLTAQFLGYSFQFYREARSDLTATMKEAASRGCEKLIVLGDGELAEIAAIVSEETAIEIAGFVAPGSERERIANRPILDSWPEAGTADGALLATLIGTRAVHDDFRKACPDVPVFVPTQLRGLLRGVES